MTDISESIEEVENEKESSEEIEEINNIIVLFNLPIIINPTKNKLFKLTTP